MAKSSVMRKPKEEQEETPVDSLATVVKRNYLMKIGKPENLFKLNCVKVNERRYRLTCWVKTGDYSTGIGPTHFVVVNDDGDIVELR